MNIKQLKITTVKDSSGVFTGDNSQYGWQNRIKQNDGFGSLLGSDNKASNSTNAVKKDYGRKSK